MSRTWIAAIVVGATAIAGAAGWMATRRGADRRSEAIAAGANVLFITVDTVRADHVPAYGYAGVQTPTMTQLAADGVRFGEAFTPVPMTLPAHASIFTGLLPFHHGVRDNGGFRLEARHPTLTSAL